MGRARLPRSARLLCHYCNERPGVTTDHIVPRAFGGPDAFWNFVPSCPTCNLEKGSTWPTCPCDKCVDAVDRFLADDKRKQRVVHKLQAQADSLTAGILGLTRQADELISRRSAIEFQMNRIGSWPKDKD